MLARSSNVVLAAFFLVRLSSAWEITLHASNTGWSRTFSKHNPDLPVNPAFPSDNSTPICHKMPRWVTNSEVGDAYLHDAVAITQPPANSPELPILAVTFFPSSYCDRTWVGMGSYTLEDDAFIIYQVLTTERRQVFALPARLGVLRSWRQVMYGEDPNGLERGSDSDSDIDDK